jgi:hypothetical protein
VAIAGTILGNPSDPEMPKRRVLMYGKGPSLATGISDVVLPDPEMWINGPLRVGTQTYTQSWRQIDGDRNILEEDLQSAGIQPQHDAESALWPTLEPGQAYSVVLNSENGVMGIGLIEFFEY